MKNIKNITRRYDDLVEVNNCWGESFENEIFYSLGQNEEDKTKLIKMISGIAK